MKNSRSGALVLGGILSLTAGLLHIAIIIGGAQWYRFFGAGEQMASMAQSGSMVPALVTFTIALIIFVWACYAFSGAGLIGALPMLRPALVIISAIYIIRGIAFIPVYFVQPELVDTFFVTSSLICLVYGLAYAIGTKQVWPLRGANTVTGNC